MIYSANITTPINTANSSPKKTVIHVTKGLVYKVEFYFPSGSAGLMGIAVFDGLYQVWPSSVGEFFIGENHIISFDDMFLKESAPYEFQCYTYNTDDTYAHGVSVRIGLVSKEVFQARYLPSKSSEVFIAVLAQMAVEREELAKWQMRMLPETPFQWMLAQQLG
ncbi:hypothetical protein LCGC14_2508870 [marine sediment metagenome]|uniref:Uncharacterized protein n=1 Tax=marine sediment metagenome TaxID=412755 RepID=A0A0F9DBI6_9ZZZZ